jgi:CRP-like cAMP-binding protein
MIAIMSGFADKLAPLLGSDSAVSADSVLFHKDDPVRHLYLIRSGAVHLVRYGETGAIAVMQRATAGSVLAESSIFSSNYHCDGLVVADGVVARADMTSVRDALGGQPALLDALTRHLAAEVQRTRTRLELLSRKTVEDRLDGWLALNGGSLPPRGSWRSVAEDIGVSPEAFYRELQRRRATAAAKH